MTQNISDGINSKRPAQRTLLATIDISKAFDAVPKYTLIDKVHNTNMHNNTKRWLANYLSGRQAHVNYNGKSSRTHNITNGVPQGSVLSPTLFNLYMHDMPNPPANNHISSYADDITITSTHNNIDTAETSLQNYLTFFENWLDQNRLKVAPAKSTLTLLTNWRTEHRIIPRASLNNTPIPHTHSTKILGVTYNTSMTFTPHIANIKTKCTPRLNALRTLTGTTFGQHKETTSLVYKQYKRAVMDHASPSWAPDLSDSNHKTLQTIQNNALRIITGCTQTTPTDHLHHETKILKVKDHLDMRGTQFLASATQNPEHPCHYMRHHPQTPRSIRHTPERYYNSILATIPNPGANNITKQQIHTHTSPGTRSAIWQTILS